MKRFDGTYRDGNFCIPRTEILKACQELGEFSILVCSPDEACSIRSVNWFNMTARKLSEQTGDSIKYWKEELITKCGKHIEGLNLKFVQEVDGTLRLENGKVKHLSKGEMQEFIQTVRKSDEQQ